MYCCTFIHQKFNIFQLLAVHRSHNSGLRFSKAQLLTCKLLIWLPMGNCIATNKAAYLVSKCAFGKRTPVWQCMMWANVKPFHWWIQVSECDIILGKPHLFLWGCYIQQLRLSGTVAALLCSSSHYLVFFTLLCFILWSLLILWKWTYADTFALRLP